MLRALVIVLFAANALFFVWSQGYLPVLGSANPGPTEPHRLTQQVSPESVKIRPAKPASTPLPTPDSANSSPAASTGQDAPAVMEATASPEIVQAQERTCWRMEGLNAEQWAVWRTRIQDLKLSPTDWTMVEELGNGRWMLYLGRYDADQLARKKAELNRLKLDFQELRNGPWALGLSLGSFESESAATAQLPALRAKGVRNARVQLERPDLKRYNLRFSAMTPAQLQALPANGKRLQRCD